MTRRLLSCAFALLLPFAALAASPVAAPPAAAPPVIEAGQSWEALAGRHLGDPAAAGELAALNGGGPAPTVGAELKLPGPARERARAAIATATTAAVEARTAGAPVEALAAAGSALEAAGAALGRADYVAAGERADDAFSLATAARRDAETAAGKRTRFSVATVAGGAAVASHGGALEVTYAGGAIPVGSGEGARLSGGAARRTELLPAPAISAPRQGELLLLPRPGSPERRSVTLRWSGVPGAAAYRVAVTRAGKHLFRARTADTEISVPLTALGEGRFSWRVTGQDGAGAEGKQPAAAWFAVELEPPPPTRLEVGKSKWE